MSTYDRLRRLFERISHISIAAVAVHASACSDTDPFDRNAFDLNVPCDDAALVAGLNPADDVDYLAIRRVTTDAGRLPPSVGITASVGVACSGAVDAAGCQETVDALPTEPGFASSEFSWAGTTRYQLVWTRGDTAGVVTNGDELRAFLGTIGDPEEAALIARFAMGHRLVCDDSPNARVVEGGVEVLTTTGTACGRGTERLEHILVIAPDGTATVRASVVVEVGDPNCAIGRMTTGATVPAHARHTELGAYFEEMAALEGSAVVAFERLARELSALGAPDTLVARARAARNDEARHAEAVGALARVFGASPRHRPNDAALPLRSALGIALENAREGCVRETFGALIATHQAHAAKDARVAAALAVIAEDETKHAALSWDLAAWLATQLDPAERAMVRAEHALAVHQFRGGTDTKLSAQDRAAVGLPDEAAARALYAELEARLFV